jgi:serine/threonine protein kinase/uncharacterized caspase-like protein
MSRKALVVGIDDYPIHPLRGCRNDALETANRLKNKHYAFGVTVLLDADVTRSAFKAALKRVLDADFSIIYFAGHGWRSEITTYLVTHDVEPEDEGVDLAYVTQAISSLAKPSQNVLLLLDCCHSGDATVRGGDFVHAPMENRDIPTIPGNGRIVMAACMGSQSATENSISGTPHGIFTYFLLQALDGAASDTTGCTTVSSIFEHVANELDKVGKQVPVLRGDQTGRIVLGQGLKSKSTATITAKHPEEQAVSEARQHAERYYATMPHYGHAEWQARGHLEACQRLAPIVDWFERRMQDNVLLIRNLEFLAAHDNILQQYQQLCNLTPGIMLDKSREIGQHLGSGTFGHVWKINSVAGSAPICFKAYHATELRDKEKVGRFNRGYKAMTQLNHPFIVKVYEDSKVPLGFFMQFVDGPNLRQFNPATTLDPTQIMEMLLRIGETLQHAHGRDVLHRDVKPENIILKFSEGCEAVSPYLTDFDLSWFSTATKLTRMAEGFGSHFYAAPEQMNSPSSPIAHKSSVDAYSFGQVMFYALNGRDPAAFDESGNRQALSEKISKLPMSENAAIEILGLYRTCTIRDANKRESDFRRICDKLSRVLALLRTQDKTLSATELLRELRFSVEGLRRNSGLDGQPEAHGIISFSSPSSRTVVLVRIKLETADHLTIEAMFTPNEIVVTGASASAARQTVNTRLDASIAPFVKTNNAKRKSVSSSNYQAMVTFEHIEKNAEGLSKSREIIMHGVDAIERI